MLACAWGHAATFVVNVALMASQWQHRASAVSLHPPINAEHEAGQIRPQLPWFFMTSIWPNRKSHQVYQLWWRVLKRTLLLSRFVIAADPKLFIKYIYCAICEHDQQNFQESKS